MGRFSKYSVIAAAVLAMGACRGTSRADREQIDPPSSHRGAQTGDIPQDQVILKAGKKEGSASLAEGTSIVFGLQIPSGMIPRPYLPQVYRFWGTTPVAHVASAVREQLRGAKVVREGTGYLIRHARVITPQGSATGREELALRIAKVENKGTQLDI